MLHFPATFKVIKTLKAKYSINAIVSVSAFSVLLSGCVMLNDDVHICSDGDYGYVLCQVNVKHPELSQGEHLFSPKTNFQNLGEYTEQMAHVLITKLGEQHIEKNIAVPPFLSLVPHYKNNELLTKDLPEFFIADLQNVGLPVAEYELTPKVDSEDAFHELYDKLLDNEDFGYVLKGTVRKATNGLMLYVKIIDIEKKTVVASTAKQIPNYLVTSAMSTTMVSEINSGTSSTTGV